MAGLTVDKIKLNTIEQIIAMPDHLVARVLDFINSLYVIPDHSEKEADHASSMDSLRALQTMNIEVPDGFDERQELMEALDEKYHTC